jgi:hypothetical protein
MTPGREVHFGAVSVVSSASTLSTARLVQSLSSFTGLDVFIAACARFTANPNSQA